MHYRFIPRLTALLILCAATAASSAKEDIDAASAEAVARWRDMKFGMFIHWGPVARIGHEISWSRGRTIPIEKYDNLYKEFNPAKFDAGQWTAVAKDAGMKYMVLTAKHTDGFCLFDTKQTDYNIMRSPFGRDVTKELADACRRQGIAFGAYYCVADWWHRDFPHGSPGGKTLKPDPDIDRYEQYMCKQLEELLRGYGPLLTVWFDYGQDFDAARGRRVTRLVRGLQPDVLINDRVDWSPENLGDYATAEQKIGEMRTDRPWETCMTIGTQWSWRPNDKVKPLKECLHTLVRVAGGDGNLLLNVGPRADGAIEPEQAGRLREMGRWLAKYGESIYGTRGGPFPRGDWGAATQKDDIIYLHVLDPELDAVKLPPLERKIVGAAVLTGGTAEVRQTPDGIEVSIPESARHEIDTIVALRLESGQ